MFKNNKSYNFNNNFDVVNVLIVDDSRADIRLIMEILKDSEANLMIDVVYDGKEALRFLKKEDKYKNQKKPDLILLDINIPKKNGIEVLQEIKENKDLRRIPVIVLTVSEAYQDIFKSYDLGANCYIIKPVDLEQFISVVKSIKDFWFGIVKFSNNFKA